MVDDRYDAAFQRGYVAPPAEQIRPGWPVAALVFSGALLLIGAAGLFATPPAIAVSVADYLAPILLCAVAPWVLAVGAAGFVGAVAVRSLGR